MEPKAFDRARAECAAASQKFQEMKAARNPKELSARWSEFLTITQRVFTKLRMATKAGGAKNWFDDVLSLQASDEMLSYVKRARDADEHGIDEITREEAGHLDLKPKTDVGFIDYLRINSRGLTMGPEAARNFKIEFHPERVVLISVRQRGVSYSPPKRHLNQDISDVTPISVAELTCAYLDRLISDAGRQFG